MLLNMTKKTPIPIPDVRNSIQILPVPNKIFLGERWQYAALPLTFTDSGSTSKIIGSDGFVMSGGVTYDHRADNSANAKLASYWEWDSLDPSYGHSSQNKQYHYHAVSEIGGTP